MYSLVSPTLNQIELMAVDKASAAAIVKWEGEWSMGDGIFLSKNMK